MPEGVRVPACALVKVQPSAGRGALLCWFGRGLEPVMAVQAAAISTCWLNLLMGRFEAAPRRHVWLWLQPAGNAGGESQWALHIAACVWMRCVVLQ